MPTLYIDFPASRACSGSRYIGSLHAGLTLTKNENKLEIKIKGCEDFTNEKEDYYGFFTSPFSWEYTIEKFKRLTAEILDGQLKNKIIETVQNLENEKDIMQ